MERAELQELAGRRPPQSQCQKPGEDRHNRNERAVGLSQAGERRRERSVDNDKPENRRHQHSEHQGAKLVHRNVDPRAAEQHRGDQPERDEAQRPAPHDKLK